MSNKVMEQELELILDCKIDDAKGKSIEVLNCELNNKLTNDNTSIKVLSVNNGLVRMKVFTVCSANYTIKNNYRSKDQINFRILQGLDIPPRNMNVVEVKEEAEIYGNV